MIRTPEVLRRFVYSELQLATLVTLRYGFDGARSRNLSVKSRKLYQLSYEPALMSIDARRAPRVWTYLQATY